MEFELYLFLPLPGAPVKQR